MPAVFRNATSSLFVPDPDRPNVWNTGAASLPAAHVDFFFNDTPTTEIYTVMNTLSLHDALPIWRAPGQSLSSSCSRSNPQPLPAPARSEEHTSELQSLITISYAVFCLKNKTRTTPTSSCGRRRGGNITGLFFDPW